MGKCLSGQMSFWAIVFLRKWPSGQTPSWANVLLGKCISGQMSFWANVFWANVDWANVFWANVDWANVVRANVLLGKRHMGKCLWANVVWVNVMEVKSLCAIPKPNIFKVFDNWLFMNTRPLICAGCWQSSFAMHWQWSCGTILVS
jgi:hypothetical protein